VPARSFFDLHATIWTLASVLLAFEDVGLGVQLQEVVEGLGHAVAWDPKQTNGPTADSGLKPDAVLLLVPRNVGAARDVILSSVRRWQEHDPAPGLVLLGSDSEAKELATSARLRFLATTAEAAGFRTEIEHAIALRYTTQLTKVVLMRALGLPVSGDDQQDAIMAVRAARKVSKDLVREALRNHSSEYVGATPLIASLREHRALTIPEVEFIGKLEGVKTLQNAVKLGPLDVWQAGRLVWALAAFGALTLTSEPPDLKTRKRRAINVTRRHLAERVKRLEKSTFYDVLEVTPAAEQDQVRHAATMLALRYDPARIGSLDLAAADELVESNWAQIKTARSTLLDWASRGRYNDYLSKEFKNLNSEWAPNSLDVPGGEKAFAIGQRALIEGEVFKAVSNFAAAARMHPCHPAYECSLAWAQFRAAVTKGQDRAESAKRGRLAAEKAQLGRRPWPRALLALGMLCAADGDSDSARWYLGEALECDPNMPAAKKILARLK